MAVQVAGANGRNFSSGSQVSPMEVRRGGGGGGSFLPRAVSHLRETRPGRPLGEQRA